MMQIHPTAIISPHARLYAKRLIIGAHSRVDDGAIITGDVELGDYVHIGAYAVVTGRYGIKIGSFTGISMFVAILSGSDDLSGRSMVNPTIPDRFKPGLNTGKIAIGQNCLIGAHSTIMPGVTIHDGVGVGSHSMVKSDCEKDTLYAGIPARKIRDRSKDIWALTAQFEMENVA